MCAHPGITPTLTGSDGGVSRSRTAWKIEIDKHERALWKAQKRTGDELPRQVQAVVETGNALETEAKGLGRAR